MKERLTVSIMFYLRAGEGREEGRVDSFSAAGYNRRRIIYVLANGRLFFSLAFVITLYTSF